MTEIEHPLLERIGELQSQMTVAIDNLKGIGAEIEAEREMKRRRMGADEAFKPYDVTCTIERSGGMYVAILAPPGLDRIRVLGLTPAMALANLALLMDQKGMLRQ